MFYIRNLKKWDKPLKMCQKSLIGHLISILVILAPKKDKKSHISKSEFWSCWQQKGYRNPISGQFELLKEYGRHYHIYLGKVIYFGSLDHKKLPKMQFFFMAGRICPLPFVGLSLQFSWKQMAINDSCLSARSCLQKK